MAQLRTLALVPLAVLALVAGACSDDDTVETSDTTATAAEPAAGDDTSGGDDGDGAGTSTEVPDACGLAEAGEVDALIGAATAQEERDVAIDGLPYSQCNWRSDDGLFVVAVIGGPERHELHLEALPGELVDGIGESAITAGGVSTETMGAVGGRTISALVDGRTLVVALRVEGQTTLEMVEPIATTVAERLAG